MQERATIIIFSENAARRTEFTSAVAALGESCQFIQEMEDFTRIYNGSKPDIVMVCLSDEAEYSKSIIRKVKAEAPNAVLIALTPCVLAEIWQDLMDAGAFELLAVTPLNPMCLAQAVRRAHNHAAILRNHNSGTSHPSEFRQEANKLPVAICETDAQGWLVYVNDKACILFGYTTEILNKPFNVLDALAPEERNRALGNIRKILEEGREGEQSIEYLALHSNGTRFPVLITSTPVFSDNVLVGMRSVIVDITDRKRAEDALRESEARYKRFFENSSDAMLIIQNNRFVDCNKATVEILGYESKEELFLKHPSELSPEYQPDGKPSYDKAEAMMRITQAKGSHHFEWDHIKKNGEILPVEVSLTALQRDGEVVLHTVWHNLTERKRAEAEKQKLEEISRRSQRMEAIGQLTGGVVHDFNNLLQAIDGYTALALAILPEEHEAREQLDEVLRASQRAATLTRQLLAFSRRSALVQKTITLPEILADLEKMTKRLIGEQIELKLSHEPDLRDIFADVGQIEQVFLNLFINARDAMPSGGKIEVHAKNAKLSNRPDDARKTVKEKEYVLVTVSDTGTGIPEDIQEHIFEPFFTTKESEKGTGMGLAIVYGIVRQHGGAIEVESRPGRGATFKIFLPVSDSEKNGAEKIKDVRKVPEGGTETILLAEDDELVRNVSTHILRSAGYEVLVAEDGEQAIQLIHTIKCPIHLYVLDVVMPKKGGRAVFDVIKARQPNTPVLFCTGYSRHVAAELPLSRAEVDLLHKPFTAPVLLGRVRKLLDNAKGKNLVSK